MNNSTKTDSSHLSPNQRAWQRFLKNKPAVFGLCWIALSVIIALLGFLIAPDGTPNVDDQVIEVALGDPGFSVQMLKVRKNQEYESPNFLSRMAFGKTNPYRQIPINKYEFNGDSIVVEVYEGMDSETKKRRQGQQYKFHVADVVYPLELSDPNFEKKNNIITFFNVKKQKESVNFASLQQTIEQDLISKKTYWLGTDLLGRDVLSRLLLGVRISLLVGLIAVSISLTIGIFLGALAGYFGGRVDDAIMLLINTVWSIPTLLLVFAIVLALGRGVGIIFLAVGLTMWVDVARIVRGQVMALKGIQFVEAAQSMGFSTWRIIARHILPNILGPVMVIAAANFAMAILIEAGLSYLGFGIKPPTPSWGTMLNENYGYALSGKPFLALIPAFAIMLMVLAFNLVGNGIRDALDVRQDDTIS